jgi:hypothetical protein
MQRAPVQLYYVAVVSNVLASGFYFGLDASSAAPGRSVGGHVDSKLGRLLA